MLTKEQNDRLCQTDAGTPMGDFARRYWFPAFLSERLPEPDCDPVGISLLGEKLVAWRDSEGRVGIMDELCPHRRASLVLARNENCALQCVYHGWRIDVEGNVLETPPEPPQSRFAQSVKQPTYKTREVNGVVWVYMGPKEEEPPFPKFPMTELPEDHMVAAYVRQNCNYLQGVEGDIEAAHAGWLHYGEMGEQTLPNQRHLRAQLTDPRPRHAVRQEQWGIQTMMRFDTPEEGETLCLVHPVVMPFFTLAGYSLDDGTLQGAAHAWIPIDDENHYVWTWLWTIDEPMAPEFRSQMLSAIRLGTGPHDDYMHPDNIDGRFIQHRDWMRDRKSFSGFDGVSAQDLAVQVSMGPIVDRTKEHLASEDMLVVQLRRFMLAALDRFEAGDGPLPGLADGFDHSTIDHRSVIIDSAVPSDDIFDNREWRREVVVSG